MRVLIERLIRCCATHVYKHNLHPAAAQQAASRTLAWVTYKILEGAGAKPKPLLEFTTEFITRIAKEIQRMYQEHGMESELLE